jgi:hypothetical protein
MIARPPDAPRTLSALLALGFLWTAGCSASQEASVVGPDAEVAEASAQSDAAPVAMEFPRTVILPNGTFTVYEPQIEDHAGLTEITAWSAAVFRPEGGLAAFGAIKFSADIVVDRDNRLVTIFDREILEVEFSELDDAGAASLTTALSASIRTEPETMPLDVVLGYVADGANDDVSVEVSLDPPTILYATTPTMLVVIDGQPVKVAVEGAEGLSFIVNTNWDLFYSEATGSFSLLLGDTWLSATMLEGPWTQAKAPEGVSALPDADRWKAVKDAIPGGSIPADEMPDILVAAAPAELIVTKGAAKLEAVPGTQLSFVANTSSDIVFSAADRFYYFL